MEFSIWGLYTGGESYLDYTQIYDFAGKAPCNMTKNKEITKNFMLGKNMNL